MIYNKRRLKIYYFVLFIIVVLSIIISIFNSYNFYINDLIKNKIMFFLPSILILIAAYIIRFLVIDINRSIKIIDDTYPFKSKNTNFKIYINFLFVAMHIGLLATITIHYHFFTGAVIYFFMHIAIIFAFSGIINLNLGAVIKNKKIFIFYLLNFIFWFFISNIIFFFFAYKNLNSLIFLPYVYILGLMTCISFLGLFYTKRSALFRLVTALGALIFLISDTFIGYAGKKEMGTIFLYFINPTYVLSIIMFTYSQLFINKKQKKKYGIFIKKY